MNDDRDLARLLDIPDPFGPPPHALAEATAAPAPSPTRAHVRRNRAIAFGAAALFEIVWVAFIEHRGDLGSLPAWSIAVGLALPLAGAAVALGGVLARGRRGLGVPVSGLALLWALPPVLFALGTLAASPADAHDGRFWALAVRCMALTSLLTAVPLALGAWAFRHAFASASASRTAALGVACGAVGAAAMSLVCWHPGALHIVVGHGTMMIGGGVIGALLGRRFTRV